MKKSNPSYKLRYILGFWLLFQISTSFAYKNIKTRVAVLKATDSVVKKVAISKEVAIKKKTLAALSLQISYEQKVKQNYQKAKILYVKLIQLQASDTPSAENVALYYGYASVLKKLGDYKGATFYLEKYIKLNHDLLLKKSPKATRDLELKNRINTIEKLYKQKQGQIQEKQLYTNKKIFIAFIALLILSLILFYVSNQNSKLKQKNKVKDIQSKIQENIINATLDGQEIERKKIAGVLHDNISALLSSAGLHLSVFNSLTQINFDEITKTRAILKEAHDTIRDLSHELLPTLLAKFGLFFALQDLCEKNSNSLITFEYANTIEQKKRYLEEFEMKVYYIITELFNNILKHSNATQAKISIENRNNILIIHIEDNGKGFDSHKSFPNEGFGLTQIRARIASMKGDFSINSKVNTGTSVLIKLPVQEKN